MTERRLAVLTSKEMAEVPERLAAEAAKIGVALDILSLHSPDWVHRLNNGSYTKVVVRIGPESYSSYESNLSLVEAPHRRAIEHVMRAFNKRDSYHILRSSGLPHPHTAIMPLAGLSQVDTPFVAKKVLGHKGLGVFLVTRKEQIAELTRQVSRESDLIVQEYISRAGGTHKRLFVVGDRVVAAMTRESPPGDFRSNAKGNIGRSYDPTAAEQALAIAATKAHRLSYAGVDLLDSDRGLLVLEANPSPGLTIESYAQKNIAREIVANLLADY